MSTWLAPPRLVAKVDALRVGAHFLAELNGEALACLSVVISREFERSGLHLLHGTADLHEQRFGRYPGDMNVSPLTVDPAEVDEFFGISCLFALLMGSPLDGFSALR